MICFLDMDGVLADFMSGCAGVHHRPSPYDGTPKSNGVWDTEKLWGISVEEFWEPIRADHDFWYTLQETPEAKGIVQAATDTFGLANCCILTAPDFQDPHCVPGKHYWIKKHFPQFEKQILFGAAKQFLAGEGRVLVDDRDRNINDFQKFGGVGIRVPRPWNQEYREVGHTLEIVKERINGIRGKATGG